MTSRSTSADGSSTQALQRSGIDRAELPATLALARGVSFRPAPAWFRRFWARDVAAVALPWAVYVRPATLQRISEGREGRLVVHEFAHVDQWRRLGPIRFVVDYLGDYLRGRLSGLPHDVAYRSIRLELEAEEIARAVTEPDRSP